MRINSVFFYLNKCITYLYTYKKGALITMEIYKCIKESFAVIGKEGSTYDGAGFIQTLWDDANSHFDEVKHLY